ncbi:MAG: hypothetical protein IJ105_01210 [Bacilli bacterium]|nr:hypothetical protein [Bacilli bacterium]
MAYNRVNWQSGTKVSDGYVTIDGTQHTVTPAVYAGVTPVNPTSLNIMDAGIEQNSIDIQKNKDILNGLASAGSLYVEDIQCKNLFNKNNITEGVCLNGDGTTREASNFCISDYIPVKMLKKYTYQGLTNIGNETYSEYYSSDKTYISSFQQQTGVNTITVPIGVAYVRFSIRTSSSDQDTFQIEPGEVATDYTEYKKIIPTIENSLDSDSTEDVPSVHAVKERTHEDITTDGSPVKCGYKVDNKDVYVLRKNGGYLPNNSSKTVDTGIIGGNLIDIKGQIYPPTGNQSPIPYNSPTTGVYGYYNPTTGLISITTLSDRSNNTFYIDFYFTYNNESNN